VEHLLATDPANASYVEWHELCERRPNLGYLGFQLARSVLSNVAQRAGYQVRGDRLDDLILLGRRAGDE
jgi:hypothetical protein